ncbi:DUF488 domain-containing protein [Glutamicibacter sp. MNS18]|uniref:DUF488 domain-containing protein n=1 Tax=Glutamicibacter sp. MNS18 TaxID=2989817 RepID=UPI00278BB0A1|nr:DUF488 family protein [Glutamicibacter sp. MNS18]
MMSAILKIKRIYAAPGAEDGYRVLVDRLWPRGMTKVDAQLDQWGKSLAPSSDLRKGWNHDPERFAEFARFYRRELDQNPHVDEFLEVLDAQQTVTLLYAAKDEKVNHAVVLRDYLLDQVD